MRGRKMGSLLTMALMLLIGFPLFVTPAHSEDGPFRARIRQRIKERMEAKPAPEARTDVDAKITQAGDYTFSFPYGGQTRYYKVHVPAQYKASAASPLLLSLHGGGGDMELQATDRFYGLISKSDQAGFIAAFPNGTSRFKSGILATWNAGKCCGVARDQNVDDVGFLKAVVQHLSHALNIDPKRVYVSGMSNGAMMSQRLACEASDVFKAIAAIAGTDNTESCHPSRPVSILEIHAKDDDHVLFNGGVGKSLSRDRSAVTDFTSVPETIQRWVKRDGCKGAHQQVLNKPGVTCDLYSSCQGGAQIKLCVTETGGHSWPGGEKPRPTEEPPSKAISADDMMWDFFKNL